MVQSAARARRHHEHRSVEGDASERIDAGAGTLLRNLHSNPFFACPSGSAKQLSTAALLAQLHQSLSDSHRCGTLSPPPALAVDRKGECVWNGERVIFVSLERVGWAESPWFTTLQISLINKQSQILSWEPAVGEQETSRAAPRKPSTGVLYLRRESGLVLGAKWQDGSRSQRRSRR